MHHVAIMKKSWGLIPKILNGEKTIESRWYQTRRAPWDKIKTGNIVFFKNSGEPVTIQANVSKILQFEIRTLSDARNIVKKYGREICLVNKNPKTWNRLPKYCVLIWLANPQSVKKPFNIDKRGFGISTAWLVVNDIYKIKKAQGGNEEIVEWTKKFINRYRKDLESLARK